MGAGAPYRVGEAEALNGLGEALLGAGLPGQARTEHAAARDLAMQTSDQYQLARSQYGLGRSSHAAGDLSAARRHWQQASASTPASASRKPGPSAPA